MERVVHDEGASSAKVPEWEYVENRHERNPDYLASSLPSSLKLSR